MIKVNFLTLADGRLCGFEIKGHAEYDEYGKDIVCSAVSSVSYMVLNTVRSVMNIDVDFKVDDDGYIYMRVPYESVNLCETILKGLKAHFILMEESYEKNIKVNYEEVK